MKTIPIYSTDSEPYFARVPEDKLATALNSVGWQQCPPEPEYDAETQDLNWDKATTQWVVSDKPPTPLAPAERYQVREWLRNNGIDPDSIPTLIAQLIPAGLEREKAVDRWNHVSRVPADHPLVVMVAAQLNLNVADIWPDVLAL